MLNNLKRSFLAAAAVVLIAQTAVATPVADNTATIDQLSSEITAQAACNYGMCPHDGHSLDYYETGVPNGVWTRTIRVRHDNPVCPGNGQVCFPKYSPIVKEDMLQEPSWELRVEVGSRL